MNAPFNPTTPTLAELAQLLLSAKQRETIAREERIALEEQIAALVGTKEEGTTSLQEGNYKIKTVGKLTRSIDSNAIQADWSILPEPIQRCIKWKADIDIKQLRALESMRDDLVPVLAQYMTTKPAKVAVTVEVIE